MFGLVEKRILLALYLKLVLWFPYLTLKLLDVRPTYVASGLPSSSTLAWYKMLESWHLAPSIGQLTVPPLTVGPQVGG